MEANPAGPRGHVAVGVDGSRHAELALEQAAAEARRRGVPLEVVHGRPWAALPQTGAEPAAHTPSREEAQALAESSAEHARRLAPGLEVVASAVDEEAPDALVRLSHLAGLTVVGSRGLGGFTGLLLGSVGLRVAAHTAGPLLVVRGDLPPEHNRVPHGTVLLGVESDADADAVGLAFREAVVRDARLVALHAWVYRHLAPPGEPLVPTSPRREDIARIARAEAAAAEGALAPFRGRYPQVRAEVRAVNGGAAHALVEASEAADVVVVAVHRRRGRLAMRLGPVVHSLLHHARCPVLVVPVPLGGGHGGHGGGHDGDRGEDETT
ncbi:universal stress protein [Streptomyces sp. KL2]|uniref:universal stress protein n=1 Tax=Streptomyces sp. KL2 TaxID=3050126 RepID=UPI00397E7788